MNADSHRLIATALQGTALAGHPVEEGLGGTQLIGDVDPTRSARRPGRCPLGAAGHRAMAGVHPARRPGPRARRRRDRRAGPGIAHGRSVVGYRRYVDDEPLDSGASSTACGQRRVTSSWQLPSISSGTRSLRPALDRWTYDALLADPSLAARAAPYHQNLAGVGSWHTWERVQLVLLPTASQWLAPAWVGYHGAGSDDHRLAWAAAMREWDQRWGAGLVAAWGTMLQFVVDRPPRPGRQAWDLAGQLLAVGGSLQYQQWQMALAVAHSDAWFCTTARDGSPGMASSR